MKDLALKASSLADDDDGDPNDEEMTLISQKFKQFLSKGRRYNKNS